MWALDILWVGLLTEIMKWLTGRCYTWDGYTEHRDRFLAGMERGGNRFYCATQKSVQYKTHEWFPAGIFYWVFLKPQTETSQVKKDHSTTELNIVCQTHMPVHRCTQLPIFSTSGWIGELRQAGGEALTHALSDFFSSPPLS